MKDNQKQARIISLSSATDPANDPLHTERPLPENAELLQIGEALSDFDLDALRAAHANVVFVSSPKAREPLAALLREVPTIEWIHARFAGIDFCHSPQLAAWQGGVMTNAKGMYARVACAVRSCTVFALRT